MKSMLARLRSIWRGARRGADEAEMAEEFGLHVELRAQDYVRSGLNEREAMRRARQEFGSPARYKEEARESRGLHRIDWVVLSWLDFKLGFRMLARYPGLTAVGCLAMAVAIALGTLYFEAMTKFNNPRIPLEDGDRIVGIQNYDIAASAPERRLLQDFSVWREQVRSITDLSASLAFERNLSLEKAAPEPVSGAEISASAFRIARVRPLLGRVLEDGDERLEAPAVVVLSHSLWQKRFESDPGIIGRTVKLGSTSSTVVGVMPEGFGFPVAQRIWAPLRLNATEFQRRTGPGLLVLGRLGPGVSLAQAQAELEAIGKRASAEYADTHKDLRPQVGPYAELMMSGGQMVMIKRIMYTVNIVFALLLVIVCANVATLVFARTATRAWEMTVRNALGASRGRIIMQLFVEALVLATVAAAIGLTVASLGMRWGVSAMHAALSGLPFWVSPSLSPATVAYAGLLTLLGASIVGIVPAIKVTGQNVEAAMRQASAERSGLRFGGLWTGIIVAQVAITVAFLPLAVNGAFAANRFQQRADAMGAERYLSAQIEMDHERPPRDSAEATLFNARIFNSYQELERRLAADPAVERVTFANRVPGQDQFKYAIVADSVAPLAGSAEPLGSTTSASVAPGFFQTFDIPVLSGRPFDASDVENDRVVLVNQNFVHHVLLDRNPIGRRIRYQSGGEDDKSTEKWYEIIGVVKNGPWLPDDPAVESAAVYHPLKPGTGMLRIALRVRGEAVAVAPRLRATVAAVDPTMRVSAVASLDKVGGGEATTNWILTSVGALVAFIVMLLSATGIHALMAFTVARRVREIGIRVALGAHPRRIVAGIFKRAFLQLGLGVLIGSAIAAAAGANTIPEVTVVLGAVGVMMLVGFMACAVPLRRALSIHPIEALRGDG